MEAQGRSEDGVMSDGQTHQISVTQANVEPFLLMMAEACPNAESTPPA